MDRVDVTETEADFVEFHFASESDAERASACFPTDVVHSGATVRQYRANDAVDGIRERLEAAGITWREEESELTEGEMWPQWPEDGEGDGEEPSVPTP